MGAPATQASLLLQKQLKDLCKHPVDGFSAGLVDDSNIFEWNITVIGPPDTLYDSGFFNAVMSFPSDYSNNPPTVRFTSEMWHPNVYSDGKATPFAYDAGHIQPNKATDPGLIYNLTTLDYLNFLCAQGYNETTLKSFSDSPFKCPSLSL